MIEHVRVRHISSDRETWVRYNPQDCNVVIGSIVVYEVADGPGTTKTRSPIGEQYLPYHVGIVLEITQRPPEGADAKANVWLIDVVYTFSHDKRKEALKHAAELKRSLDAARKQYADLEMYAIIAAANPAAATMLEEYKGALMAAGVIDSIPAPPVKERPKEVVEASPEIYSNEERDY